MNEFVDRLFEIRHHIEDTYGLVDYVIESTNLDFMRGLKLTKADEYWDGITGVKIDSSSISSAVYRSRLDYKPNEHWNIDGTSMSVAVSAAYKMDGRKIHGHVSYDAPQYPSSSSPINLLEYGENVWLIPPKN